MPKAFSLFLKSIIFYAIVGSSISMAFANDLNYVPQKQELYYRPVMQDMLDRVSPDSVEYLQKKLCSFHTRHARSKCSKEELIPYITELYKQYGCDTVIALSLGSAVSDELIGVRRGVKDPTLLKFVSLGGHIDSYISISPSTAHQGANNNATGAVAALEACRVHQHYEFEHTILYCAHNASELGLLGSRAVTNMLKKQGCQSRGASFSYDQFGMEASPITFRVFDQNPGAEHFVETMKKLKSLYSLKQPSLITFTSSSSTRTDTRNYWTAQFPCAGNDPARFGAGPINTREDIITTKYDPVFQAEVAKLGIITTAEYATPITTNIVSSDISKKRGLFTYRKTRGGILFNSHYQNSFNEGILSVYNVQGQLLRRIALQNNGKSIFWDGATKEGVNVSNNAILFVQFTDGVRRSTLTLVWSR